MARKHTRTGDVTDRVPSHTGPSQAAIRALVVDDYQPLLRSVSRMLRTRGIDVAVACDLADARSALRRPGKPLDIVILDLHLENERGEDLLGDIDALNPRPRVLLLSDFLYDVKPSVLQHKVDHALPRVPSLEQLPDVVEKLGRCTVAEDPQWESPEAESHVTAHTRSPSSTKFAQAHGLTDRQASIIALLADEVAPKEIAARMGVSFSTVRTYIQRICRKVGCSGARELMVRFFRHPNDV